MNKVVIAGGTGFVGGHLGAYLGEKGYEAVVLSRSGDGGKFRGVKWDGKSVGDWAKELEGAAAVINLSGAPINKKWTDSYKTVLKDSRVEPTRALGAGIAVCENPPAVWVNASAVGIYGDGGERSMSESSPTGEGFMAELASAWEGAVWETETSRTRKVVARFGVVLGSDGGALPILKKVTQAFLGGPVGSGKQYVSWVHIEDLCRMFGWFLDSEVNGAVNVVSPDPVTNADMMAALRAEIGRPPVPAAPAFLVKTMTGLIGLEGAVLLQGQRVYPVIAEANGFRFEYPELGTALRDLLQTTPEAWQTA